MRRFAIVAILTGCMIGLMTIACSQPYSDCSDQMAQIRTAFGTPEKITYYYSGNGYYAEHWWYCSRGLRYSFAWGDYYDCEVSVGEFTPIACDCSEEMAKRLTLYGPPEEVSTYTTEGYNSVDWWYWSKGIEFTFEWGDLINDGCGCDVSTYTFDPITHSFIETEIQHYKQVVKSTQKCLPCNRKSYKPILHVAQFGGEE